MSWDFGGTPGGGAGDAWETTQVSQGQQPHSTTTPGGFGQESLGTRPAGSGLATASAPFVWLAVSLLLAAVAIVVYLLTDGVLAASLAWLVGGPVAIGLFAIFVQLDTTRRAEPYYAESSLADWGRRAVVLMSLVAVALNAWSIADFIARGGPS